MRKGLLLPQMWASAAAVMRIILSRKGFDSGSGGGPSPIVDGRPFSLPIPAHPILAGAASRTSYADLGLSEYVQAASKGRLGGKDLCHHDPMFVGGGRCLFGQCGAAQTHLANQGVGIGDVFVFFGLFREEHTGELHHRIFGYMRIEEMVDLRHGAPDWLVELEHPHALEMHHGNDVIYCGQGCTAQHASAALRLTVPGGPPSLWTRPKWLKRGGLSYHDRPERWAKRGLLQSVARGQEFVANVGRRSAPAQWLEEIIAAVEAPAPR
jgi:hypothetical protein